MAPEHPRAFSNDAPARECLVRWGDPKPTGSLGAYRFWMTQATRDRWAVRDKNSNAPLDITFVYGGARAIYNAGGQIQRQLGAYAQLQQPGRQRVRLHARSPRR